MILQDPPLSIKPNQWRAKNNDKYDENIHKKILGSVKTSNNVLYYVWPIIARNGDILDDQKMDVIVRDNMYLSIEKSKYTVTPKNNQEKIQINIKPKNHVNQTGILINNAPKIPININNNNNKNVPNQTVNP